MSCLLHVPECTLPFFGLLICKTTIVKHCITGFISSHNDWHDIVHVSHLLLVEFSCIVYKTRLQNMEGRVEVDARFDFPQEGNSSPCEKQGCKCCRVISKKCRVTSSQNNRTFPTQRKTCCSDRNVIYLIECTKCIKSNQYVGQTSRPLKTRLAEHRATSSTKTHFPLYKHFLQRADHNFEKDITVTILEVTSQNLLLEKENNWIKAMRTVYPNGLNSNLHS